VVETREREPVPSERSEAGAQALLAVDDLDVRFHTAGGRVAAVSAVSLRVAPGQTLGIVGESGSGKSTTALALVDLVPPPGRVERATIRWRGEPIDYREVRGLRGSEITMIFQDPMTSLNPLLPVGLQITETLAKHKGMRRAAARRRAEELLDLVGVPSPRERLRQLPHELSGGMRQRVMIAMAVAPEPKLLLADEPTTALDSTVQAQILELIARLQRELGLAMILITHDLGVVARVCDRVAVMYAGRVVEEASVHELFALPRHRYTEALLAAVPRGTRDGNRLVSIPGSPPRRIGDLAGCAFAPRCGYATDECRRTPALTGGGDRRFACWHPATRAGSRPSVRVREEGDG
jgi:oligopeptide/dipeptide ABC transporter ATP-binding protein